MKYVIIFLFPYLIFLKLILVEKLKTRLVIQLWEPTLLLSIMRLQILDGFGISNDNGYYSLNLKKDTEFNIKITFIGYKPIELNLSLSEDVVKDFILEEQAEALDEVELVYEMPVEIKGDTIVYSADAFNTGTEKLSDVLANMPGIEVNEDGRIEVEGQEVRKIQIEGKDFFDSDTKLAISKFTSQGCWKS